MCKLNNIFTVRGEIIMEFKNYLKLGDNEIAHPNMWNAVKDMFQDKFMALNGYTTKRIDRKLIRHMSDIKKNRKRMTK